MDEKLKEDIKTVAAIERLKDEEAFKGENIAKKIEIDEEIEEKEYHLKKLQKRYKTLWGTFILGVIAFIIVLLYMIYEMVVLPETSKTITDVPKPVVEVDEPKETPKEDKKEVNQAVSTKDLVYELSLPKIDKSKIKRITLGDIVSTLDDKDVLKYNEIDYYSDGTGFKYEEDNIKTVSLEKGVSVFSLSSLESVIGKSKKVYKLVDEPSKSTSDKDTVDPVSHVSSCCVIREDSIENYYNKDTLKAAHFKDNVVKKTPYKFTIQVYSDEVSEDTIKDILEDFTYNKIYKDYTNVVKAIAIKLSEKVNKFSISYKDYTFSYYDKVVERDNVVVGIKGDEEEIPETVKTFNITDVEVSYDTLACAYSEHWY